MSTKGITISYYIACTIFGLSTGFAMISAIDKNPKLPPPLFFVAICVGALGIMVSNLMVLRKRYNEKQ